MTVVTNTLDAIAGSTPMRSRPIGISVPASPATAMLTTMAAAMTKPIARLENQSQVTRPASTANSSPLAAPINSSLPTKRRVLASVRSFMASARTATVRVWVPALPPMEATIGMSTASATIRSMVASNRPITMEATIAVMRLTTSQGKRARAVSRNAL